MPFNCWSVLLSVGLAPITFWCCVWPCSYMPQSPFGVVSGSCEAAKSKSARYSTACIWKTFQAIILPVVTSSEKLHGQNHSNSSQMKSSSLKTRNYPYTSLPNIFQSIQIAEKTSSWPFQCKVATKSAENTLSCIHPEHPNCFQTLQKRIHIRRAWFQGTTFRQLFRSCKKIGLTRDRIHQDRIQGIKRYQGTKLSKPWQVFQAFKWLKCSRIHQPSLHKPESCFSICGVVPSQGIQGPSRRTNHDGSRRTNPHESCDVAWWWPVYTGRLVAAPAEQHNEHVQKKHAPTIPWTAKGEVQSVQWLMKQLEPKPGSIPCMGSLDRFRLPSEELSLQPRDYIVHVSKHCKNQHEASRHAVLKHSADVRPWPRHGKCKVGT